MRHFLHVTGPAERWDHIAHRYYGDASLYGPIIDANRSLFVATLAPIPPFLPPKLTLRIPVLETRPRRPSAALPPWKRPV